MIQEASGTSEILTRAEAAAFIRVSEKTLGEMARASITEGREGVALFT